jgi:hypothetical protein
MGLHYSISIDDGKNEFIMNHVDKGLLNKIVELLNLEHVDGDGFYDYGYEPIKLTKSKANILVDKLRKLLVKIENNSYLIRDIEKDIAKTTKENVKEFEKYKKKYSRLNAHMKFFKFNQISKSYLRMKEKELNALKLKGGWPNKDEKKHMKNIIIPLITELERLTKNNSFSKSKISLEIDGGQGWYRYTRKEAKDSWAMLKKENPKEYEMHMKYYKRIAKKNKTKFKPL